LQQAIQLKESRCGIFFALIIGCLAFFIRGVTANPLLDPLFVALLIGIMVNSFVPIPQRFRAGIRISPSLFIPVGVVLYGCVNLKFEIFHQIKSDYIFLILFIFIVYIISVLFLSSLFKIKEKISYLLTTGSAICGASAIIIASKAIDADSDEVSISLVPVFISGIIGLFVILPFLQGYLNMANNDYAVLSGSTLQFTGFVKVAARSLPVDMANLAISVKAVRYTGLLFLVPLFASFSKGRLHVPWYLWGFLAGGLAFTFFPGIEFLRPVLKVILTLFWSIAMAAIGLSANIKNIFSPQGVKALIVSCVSFLLAVGIFLLAIQI